MKYQYQQQAVNLASFYSERDKSSLNEKEKQRQSLLRELKALDQKINQTTQDLEQAGKSTEEPAAPNMINYDDYLRTVQTGAKSKEEFEEDAANELRIYQSAKKEYDEGLGILYVKYNETIDKRDSVSAELRTLKAPLDPRKIILEEKDLSENGALNEQAQQHLLEGGMQQTQIDMLQSRLKALRDIANLCNQTLDDKDKSGFNVEENQAIKAIQKNTKDAIGYNPLTQFERAKSMVEQAEKVNRNSLGAKFSRFLDACVYAIKQVFQKDNSKSISEHYQHFKDKYKNTLTDLKSKTSVNEQQNESPSTDPKLNI